ELDAQMLLALRRDLAAQQLVGGRHEIVPAQPVQRRLLGISRCPARGQDRGDPAGLRRGGAGARNLQKATSTDATHKLSSRSLSNIAATRPSAAADPDL